MSKINSEVPKGKRGRKKSEATLAAEKVAKERLELDEKIVVELEEEKLAKFKEVRLNKYVANQIRVFSPIINGKGISPIDYVQTYPELGKAPETKNLRGVELIWCWYYGCKSSPYQDYGSSTDKSIKMRAITKLVFEKINMNRNYSENILRMLNTGKIPPSWNEAIEYFKNIDVTVRSEAKEMIDTMMDQLKEIVAQGVHGFLDSDGNPDYDKYVRTMKVIRTELNEIIKVKELGFGVSEFTVNLDENESEGTYWNTLYLNSKAF